MRALLRAPLLSLSGYGVHSRQVYQWLEGLPGIQLDVEILQWGMTTWLVNPDDLDGMVGRIMSKSKEIKPGYDITFQLQLPDEWDTSLGKVNIGITAAVETHICSTAWIEACNKMNAIIVPSEFTRSVLRRSGTLSKEVYVIPEWYNENLNKAEKIKLNLNPKFNFLSIGTITARNAEDDRKNMFYMIKWFCEAFKDNKKVGLVLKCSHGKGTAIDRKITLDTVQNVLSQVRVGKFPKVSVVHGNMDEVEVAGLYNHPKINCYVTATRGEGYGLPLVDAAASGMPVIATNWSGHLDFLGDNFLKVSCELTEISQSRIDSRIFIKDSKWAKVNEEDFKEKLISAYKENKKYAIDAKKHQKYVKENFSKEAVIKIYNKFLSNLNEI